MAAIFVHFWVDLALFTVVLLGSEPDAIVPAGPAVGVKKKPRAGARGFSLPLVARTP